MTNHTRTEQIDIIGIGNEYRNDDGVGLFVARRLKELQLRDVNIRELSGEGVELMEAMEHRSTVFLVDAVYSGALHGTTYRIDAASQTIPSRFFHYSTHSFSVAESIELARTIGRLPNQCILFGIEGRDFGNGMVLSESVQAAAEEVVMAIRSEINSVLGQPVAVADPC
jgi:hydrogenase maturation protease